MLMNFNITPNAAILITDFLVSTTDFLVSTFLFFLVSTEFLDCFS